ncbi:MAG: hypothetical protein F6K50_31655, partial [Moorea sp. SIO3I7]|nr:hypothetical protein [Moorena sp. SIO3I7]
LEILCRGIGNRESGIGNRESGTGNSGSGNREEVLKTTSSRFPDSSPQLIIAG